MPKRLRVAELIEEIRLLRGVLQKLYHAADPINITYQNSGGLVPQYIMDELEISMKHAKEFIYQDE